MSKKMGAPVKYTAKVLEAKIKEYYKYVDDNPAQKRKVETYKGETKEYIEYIQLPYTIEGLCNFLNIDHKTFSNNENYPDLFPIVTRARQIIRENKLSGATAGIFNANIVIRDLSLRDSDAPQVINNIIPLNSNEVKINEELIAAQGKPQQIGGYYHPNFELTDKAMRPSATLNGILAKLN